MTREPGTIDFKSTPPSPSQGREPGSLTFNEPVLPSLSQDTPKALTLPDRVSPAATLFAQGDHPLLGSVLARARTDHAALFLANQERIVRYIKSVLPLHVAAVEELARHTLQKHAHGVTQLAALTDQFTQLNAGSRLDRVMTKKPLLGFIPRSKNVAADLAQLHALRISLSETLAHIRNSRLFPVVEHLEAALISLQGVCAVVAIEPASQLQRTADNKLMILRTAIAQERLAYQQLQVLEATASTQLAHCERLLSVSLPAVAMADAQKKHKS